MSFSTTQSGSAAEVREAVKAQFAEGDHWPDPFAAAIDAELAKLDQDRPVSLVAHGHSWGEGQTAGNITLHLDISVPHHSG